MKQLWLVFALVWPLALLSGAQSTQAGKLHNIPSQKPQPDKRSAPRQEGQGLVEIAEQDAGRMEGPMRAWALWQVARVYQTTDKKKALQLLDAALAETAVMKEIPVPEMQESLTRTMSGNSAQSAKAWLQKEIAHTMIMVDPARADELLQTLDPANRGPILQTLMSYYEAHKLTDRAVEQFYRVTAEDEAPYAAAVRIIASLKPEQSSEITGIFGACLTSYRTHAPHNFPAADAFPMLIAADWQRVPKELARDSIDEVIQQAQDGDSAGTLEGGGSAGSLLQFRLLQLMPALGELEESKAKEYRERFPALASSKNASAQSILEAKSSKAASRSKFRITGDSGNLFRNMAERPLAEEAASQADDGHAADAFESATNIANPDLRAQVFEYISRVVMKKDPATASSALSKMLAAVENTNLDRQPTYYSSAAAIFIAMGDLKSAREAIEKGVAAAAQLYKQDTDNDDPNTALEVFWPSTSSYCLLLKQARRISETWALELLKAIDDPKVRIAAEIAIAGDASEVSQSRAPIITAKRKTFRMSLDADSPADPEK